MSTDFQNPRASARGAVNYYTKQGGRYTPLLTKEQAWGFQGLMATAAHRYCMGRSTYIVGCCADWLIAEWENLPENVRAIIQRDTEEEFARDDEARERGDTYKPLGHDCDRREWERVRALWTGLKTNAGDHAAPAGGRVD